MPSSRSPARVTIVNQHFPPLPGGGSLRVDAIASALTALSDVARPIEATVLTGSISDAPSRPYTVLKSLGNPVPSDQSLRARLVGELTMALRACWQLSRMQHRPDLLVISIPSYFMGLVIAAYSRLRRIPYVVDLRDIYPETYADAGLIDRQSLIYRAALKLSKNMYLGARLVVTATNGLKRSVETVAGGKEIQVHYNGYPDFLKSISHNKAERFTASFHGTLGFFQDIEGLMEVARLLEAHGIDLLVIGYGRKQDLVEKNATANVKFMGRLPLEQTLEAVATSHVGLCMRTNDQISMDAFPLKIFECLGVGVPVLVSPPCEGGEFVEANGCGSQFQHNSPQEMVDEILKLRDDATYYQRRLNAVNRSARHLTRSELAGQYAKSLLSLL